MDSIDRRIAKILQGNARVANAEIARRVGLAPSAIHERVRKLKESGVIREWTAHIAPEVLDLGLLAFLSVKTNETAGDVSAAEEIAAFPEVLEVHHVAGEDCYLVKVRTKNTEALANMLREKIGAIPSVTSTRTTIAMETIKETTQLPIMD